MATVHLLYGVAFELWGESLDHNIIRFEQEMCQYASALITISKSMGGMIRSRYGVPEERVHAIYKVK